MDNISYYNIFRSLSVNITQDPGSQWNILNEMGKFPKRISGKTNLKKIEKYLRKRTPIFNVYKTDLNRILLKFKSGYPFIKFVKKNF